MFKHDIIKGKVAIVLDSQAGSCGKGKFIGYLSQKDKYDIAINNFMSNAGHTYVDDIYGKVITQHLLTSIVNKECELIIGAGAAITPSILFNEIIHYRDILGDRQITIHPRAAVIESKHILCEKLIIKSGSTFKGCGAAQADKIMRASETQLFGKWYKFNDWSSIIDTITNERITDDDIKFINNVINVDDSMEYLNDNIDNGCNILIEGSQGCDLDINFGLEYPHTTSRQCHAGQLVADCGISPFLVTDIIMIMRPYPIRISNSTSDYTGKDITISSGNYGKSIELTWDIIKERCGAPDNIEFGEMTTVTKKTRRVFEMNWDRLKYVTLLNRPNCIALNFAQYIDYNALGCKEWKNLPKKVKEFVIKIEDKTNTKVGLIGTGANNNDIIDRR